MYVAAQAAMILGSAMLILRPYRASEPPNPFAFQSRQAPKILHAWDRVPASSRAPGKKGHKVWKRATAPIGQEVATARDGGIGSSSPRVIKRQRTKRTIPTGRNAVARRNLAFVAMRQEAAPGTPKSAQESTQSAQPSFATRMQLSSAFMRGSEVFLDYLAMRREN